MLLVCTFDPHDILSMASSSIYINIPPLSTHIHDPHIETRPQAKGGLQPTSLMDADTDTTGQEIPIKIKIGLNVTLSSIPLVLTCNMPETKWCLQQTAAHFLLMT